MLLLIIKIQLQYQMFSKNKKETDSQGKGEIVQPTYGKVELKSKESYGEQDVKGELVNQAGKIGKAQHNFFRQSEKVEEVREYRSIPASQLAEHKSVQSAWLSLNGTVYDVTSYMKYHPGGRLILQGCGGECSQLFNKYHSWVNGQFILKKYKLGYLVRD